MPVHVADGEEVFHINENHEVVIDELVRQYVIVSIPIKPLCREACKGLCPECGANLNADPDHDHADPVDPRWEGLAGWTEPENEEN